MATPQTDTEQRAKQCESEFKRQHSILIAFLALIISAQCIGTFLFTNGFLLTRTVLDQISECANPPVELYKTGQSDCWHPKSFDKAIVLIIDALRYDFTVPLESRHHHHNALEVLFETAMQKPSHAILRPFIADPPTTTLQRLKGLTTGSLPTFIEAGTNFAGNAIEEDNLITQLRHSGKTLVHLGDDTWDKLFPDHFDGGLSRPLDSFNVKDLHSVDNGVTDNLLPLLTSRNDSRWDVIIGHFLGVDHVGHVKGPDDPVMTAKLRQMDSLIRQVAQALDDRTLLVVLGDHGMDSKGNHGGESDDEVEAALWMYSKRPVFGRSQTRFNRPPQTAKERPLAQIDIVPTLALLLGVPVPFSNLGFPIEEAFIGQQGNDLENLAIVNRLVASQIHRFRKAYSRLKGSDIDTFKSSDALWHLAVEAWSQDVVKGRIHTAERWESLAKSYLLYQDETLAVFRSLWASFDLINMGLGVVILTLTLLALAIYATSSSIDQAGLRARTVWKATMTLCVSTMVGFLAQILVPSIGFTRALFGLAGVGLSLALLLTSIEGQASKNLIPQGLWSWTSFVSVFLLAAGFGSNSFTVWEEESLLFFLGVFATLLFAQSLRLKDVTERWYAFCHSAAFMTAIRVSAVSRICREEQLPQCSPLFYASSTSTTTSGWRNLIPTIVAVALPGFIKAHYKLTASYQASGPLWIGIGFRGTLILVACYWILRAGSIDLFGLSENLRETIALYVAQLVIAIALGAGATTFGWQPPLVGIERVMTEVDEAGEAKVIVETSPMTSMAQTATKLVLHGSGNVFGSHFCMLPTTVLLLPLLLVSKEMAQMSLFCGVIAIMSLFELLHVFGLQRKLDGTGSSVSTVGPIILALLAHFLYFKTGHQAAFASIQWDMAFVATRTLRYPWSPLFVTLNTFAAQMLCAAAVPAVILWREPLAFSQKPGERTSEDMKQRRRILLTEVAKAQMLHFLVYGIINLATTIFSAHLRRHLMLYRVFCPRWMLGGVGMVVAELAGCFIGVLGMRWTVMSVSSLFGW